MEMNLETRYTAQSNGEQYSDMFRGRTQGFILDKGDSVIASPDGTPYKCHAGQEPVQERDGTITFRPIS